MENVGGAPTMLFKWVVVPVVVGLGGYFVVGPRTKPPKNVPIPSAMTRVLGGQKPETPVQDETAKPSEKTTETPANSTPASGAPRVDVGVRPVEPSEAPAKTEELPRRRRRRRRHHSVSEAKPPATPEPAAPSAPEPAAPSAPYPASDPDG